MEEQVDIRLTSGLVFRSDRFIVCWQVYTRTWIVANSYFPLSTRPYFSRLFICATTKYLEGSLEQNLALGYRVWHYIPSIHTHEIGYSKRQISVAIR